MKRSLNWLLFCAIMYEERCDNMARTFKITKDGAEVVAGASPLVIPNLTAETKYPAGTYKIIAVEDGKESAPVDVPEFTTTATAG